MRKLINAPESFVEETIEGILGAHPGELTAVGGNLRVLARGDGPRLRVGIVTGGGSGHLPVFLGYVGPGLCSAVAIGNVFSSPSAEQVLAATKASDGGRGVLHLFGNYGGDVMNFALAADMAEIDGIDVRTVLVNDDVLSAPAERRAERRGVAGLFLAYKCAGAAAERGDDLASVAALAERAVAATGTVGVGLSPTILPATGSPSFDLPDGEMEIGIGIHGEPGRHRGPLKPADHVADEMYDAISSDLALAAGDRVVLLVNGLGATPLEELYVLHRRVAARLRDSDVEVYRSYVGNFATSLEMAGASLSLMRVDDELAGLVDAPAASPFFRQ